VSVSHSRRWRPLFVIPLLFSNILQIWRKPAPHLMGWLHCSDSLCYPTKIQEFIKNRFTPVSKTVLEIISLLQRRYSYIFKKNFLWCWISNPGPCVCWASALLLSYSPRLSPSPNCPGCSQTYDTPVLAFPVLVLQVCTTRPVILNS
jgi:hypothetical protein